MAENRFLAKRLIAQRKMRNMTQQEVANYLGITRAAYSHFETGRNEPDNETLTKLADLFEVSTDYLLGRTDFFYYAPEKKFFVKENQTNYGNIQPASWPSDTVKIPVLGSIPAGIPIEAVEDIIDYEEIPVEWLKGDREYFALKVKGDSMFPEYLDGDIVIVRKQSTCDSGDDCVVIINGAEATLKRVNILKDGIELEAVNKMYGKKKFSKEEIENLPVQILGVVVELRRKKK